MMTEDTDIIKKAFDVLVGLNTAVKNIRLYPPTSASVLNTVEKLHQSFLNILAREEQIVFAESEKNLLICGNPISQKDQEKPHIASLLGLLITLGLKSISFNKGLEKEELSFFVELLSRKPDSIKNDGGLVKLLSDRNIAHIILDQKVYVAMDKDHKILSGLDISDDQITKFFMLTHPDMDVNSQKFKDLAANPKALSQAFEAGLAEMIVQKGTLSNVQLSEKLDSMLTLLDKITGSFKSEDRNGFAQDISRSVAAADPEVARQLTSSNMEHLFGGLLMQYLMTELANEKLGGQETTGGVEGSGSSGEVKSRLRDVAEKFNLRLGDERTLLDEGLMSVLPKIIEQLIVQKEQRVLDDMLQRLAENLKSEQSDTRAGAAKGLADILEHLPAERKKEILNKVSDNLLDWIKTETVMSSAYSKIHEILKNVIQDHLTQKLFSEALTYLDAFSSIACGEVQQTDAAKKLAADLLTELSSTENIHILLSEINADENKEKTQTGQVFAALGSSAVNNILDQLRNNNDSDERVKMMHLITSADEKALPLVTGRIRKKEPWYYLRNLAYMLGQIGNEESARTLSPLLRHENIKLRQEALRSIQRIGGNSRGTLLLSALPQTDDEEFKLNIIDVLGQSKAVEAVDPLLEMLKNRPLMVSAQRINLEEKICMALGAIGSPDAIPALSEIAETKSFLGLRSYPDKVKGAAARALVTLRRKVAESGPENL